MPATVSFVRATGVAPGVNTVVSSISAVLVDSPIDTEAARISNPVMIPSTGSAYSYEVYLRLKAETAPSVRIDNLKIWGPATPVATGVTLWMKTVPSYVAPAIPADTTGFSQQDTTYNSESNALEVDGELNEAGEYSAYVVLMLKVDSNATPGEIGPITLSYSYREQ